ncbi:MAG TPA: hypothetical protein VFB34_08485 [Chloroflexota bacterium]|nr:hypothetical protein [Chloroflexota bacterium]
MGREPLDPDFNPICGVSLQTYVEIAKSLAARGYDQSRALEVAAAQGVDEPAWVKAMSGWNARIERSPAVAQRFNVLYGEA